MAQEEEIEHDIVFDETENPIRLETQSLPNIDDPEVERERRYSFADVLFHPLNASYGVLRWAGGKVDRSVISPVTNRISESILHPTNLSALLWHRIKDMTPQRARDVTRIVSTALANSIGVLKGDRFNEFNQAKSELTNTAIGVLASESGRDVIVDYVATVTKAADAMNTPEVKKFVDQITNTFQNCVDLLASDEGKELTQSLKKASIAFLDVAASPESHILLAELATNVLHALEIEHKTRTAEQVPTEDGTENRRRCGLIEKKVLQRMGLDERVIGDWENQFQEPLSDQERLSEADSEVPETVVIPEWNQRELRSALRRRHVRATEVATQRDPSIRSSQRMRTALTSRLAEYGHLSPAESSFRHMISRLMALLFLFIFCCIFLYVIWRHQ